MTGLLLRLSSCLSLRHRRSGRARGFSLIELLLVLALIGILSGIAIPSFLGQRRRARVIGDAQSNTRILAMALENRKAENGVYGTAGTTVTWTAGVPSDTTFLPSFVVKNASQMNYSVAITNGGLSYGITVTDPTVGGAPVLTADQSGVIKLDTAYNK